MPLNVISGGGGMPFLRFSIDDNEWGMSSQQGGDLIPIDWESPVLIDVENIDMGWLRLMGGRDFQEWPRDDSGIHQPTEKPGSDYKQAFRVLFYSSKLFDDEPVRELSSDRAGLLEFIRKLHDEAEPKFGKGQVPAVKMLKAMKVKLGKGNTKIPQFEIVGWKDRPEALEGGVSEPVEQTSALGGAEADDSFDDVEI